MNNDAQLVLGFLVGVLLLPLLAFATRIFSVSVAEGEALLITRFGKLVQKLDRPGLHFLPDRAMPWVHVDHASLRREYRNIEGIMVNDARGTTVIVDIFLELRVTDPVKALFGVTDWERAMTNVVSHAVISLLGTRELSEILVDRKELRTLLAAEIADDTERWGVHVERVFLRDVRLLPELSQQLLRSVAVKLERWKVDIEEEGRQKAAMLEAEMSVEVASLVAEARTQYPLAVGRAYADLEKNGRVRAAYDELYELSLLHPHRTIAFVGFDEGDMRAVDAAMLVPDTSAPQR